MPPPCADLTKPHQVLVHRKAQQHFSGIILRGPVSHPKPRSSIGRGPAPCRLRKAADRWSMTAQTRKLPAMTYRARLLVKPGVLAVVCVQKIRRVVQRFQRRARRMAKLAAIGRIRPVMANQTIRHDGHVGHPDLFRFLQAAVAGLAWVVRIQKPPDVPGRRQVGSLIDSPCNHGRDVPQRQMLFMREILQRRLWVRSLIRGPQQTESCRQNRQRRYPL